MINWASLKEFKSAQKEIELPAGAAVHIPVTVRYIDHDGISTARFF